MTFGVMSMVIGCGGGGSDSKKDSTTKNETIVASDIKLVTVGSQELTSTQADVLRVHNEKRVHYYLDANLTYNMDLEKVAQVYADVLAKSGKFEHDISNNRLNGYGENLYAHSDHRALTVADAMPHWYDEEKPLYNYADGSCSEDYYENGKKISCGHYTQVIWQDTREVGCATSKYLTGEMNGGYVYVCKYKDAGNISSSSGTKLKPYCEYDRSDIFLRDKPSTIALADKKFNIELIVEDRINCTRADNYNSAIEFSADLKTAKVKDFEIFNTGEYANTLEFDRVSVEGTTINLKGTNKNIVDERFKGKNIYMKFTVLGESSTYYSVDLEWNGLDETLPEYSRNMKAKLYK